jgi:hypothetical protein
MFEKVRATMRKASHDRKVLWNEASHDRKVLWNETSHFEKVEYVEGISHPKRKEDRSDVSKQSLKIALSGYPIPASQGRQWQVLDGEYASFKRKRVK